MNNINSLAVFCGSSNGSSLEYQLKAEKMGQALVKNNITLIYGGGNIGLMGKIASYVYSNNIDVIGILPKKLNLPQVVNKNIETKRIIVEGMHERKAKMYELSDGFIAMPGGIGTFEEFFEAFTWLQLGYHSKPIGLLNVNGFYDDLIKFLIGAVKQGFIKQIVLDKLVIEEEPSILIEKMKAMDLRIPQKI
ncbi:MAG: TIGR00730 family Rossman fold protein [Spirochaetaceae bacterium]|nr:TIGR00730 family Rossman fold protein [Spirochaetaceae bacterium]